MAPTSTDGQSYLSIIIILELTVRATVTGLLTKLFPILLFSSKTVSQ